MFNKKEKTYEFSIKGLEKAKKDMQKEKIDNISNIIIYSVIGLLLLKGILGAKFLTTYTASTITSKTVKYLVRSGVI